MGWRDGSVIKSMAALAEDLGSVPSTHMGAHKPLSLQFQESGALVIPGHCTDVVHETSRAKPRIMKEWERWPRR